MDYYDNANKFMDVYQGHEHEFSAILKDDGFTMGDISTMKKAPSVWQMPTDLVIKVAKEYVYYLAEQASRDPEFIVVLNQIKHTLSSGEQEPYASTAHAYRQLLDNNLDVYAQLYEVYLKHKQN